MTPESQEPVQVDESKCRRVSRRTLLRSGLALGLGGGIVAAIGLVIDFLTPRGIEGPGGLIRAGSYKNYAPGTKTGCTLPWRETFSFYDPDTGTPRQGWFRCPCHAATFDHAGERVFGPAPRALDRFELEFVAGGSIHVHTGRRITGTQENARRAVKPPGA